MTRLLLIGNSHLASFRKGWDRLQEAHPDVSVDFFAQPGPEYYGLRLDVRAGLFGALDETAFTTRQLERLDRLNGARTIDISRYDQIMVVGNQHGAADLIKIIAHRDVTGLRRTKNALHLLSGAAFDAILQDLATAFLPAPEWAARKNAPVTFHAMPRPAETVFEKLDPDSNLGKTYARLNASHDGLCDALARLGAAFDRKLRASGLRFVEQPEATLTRFGFTRAQYNTDLESFAGTPMQARDYSHMNGDYGALCLHAAFPDILPRRKAA